MADQPTALERFVQGILPENPVYRQLLGMCPTLAVTNGMKPAMTMACSVAFVLLCANVVTSLIRGLLKPHLRIVVFTLTIATFVTIADRVLAAYLYQMSKTLGPYIPLIIVNCLIICRCEVCASKQGVFTAASDALGQSLGLSDWPWPALPCRAGTSRYRRFVWHAHTSRCMARLGHHGIAPRCLHHPWDCFWDACELAGDAQRRIKPGN